MEKFIKVYDNIISNTFQDYIENLSTTIIPWFYTPNITDRLDSSKVFSPGFGHPFYINSSEHDDMSSKCQDFNFILNNILYKFAFLNNFFISNIYQGRLFMHLPSSNPGKDIIHTDLDFPHYVCLYYVNDSDGDTILFKEDKKTEIKRVTPKKGRIAFFDGSIPHCSSRPVNNTRIILNYDFSVLNL